MHTLVGDVPAGRPSNWEEQRRTSFAGKLAEKSSFVNRNTFFSQLYAIVLRYESF